MNDFSSAPRIAPLPIDEQDSEVLDLLSGVGVQGTPATNIYTTLVRHRGLFRKWAPFGGKLVFGKLPARDRELLILRTAWRCQSEYEFGQHTLIATRKGFTMQDLADVKVGPNAEGWDEFDGALLRAVDELHENASITDATWATLATRYDDNQLIELPMLVGHYHLLAFALNSLEVQREAGVPGFTG